MLMILCRNYKVGISSKHQGGWQLDHLTDQTYEIVGLVNSSLYIEMASEVIQMLAMEALKICLSNEKTLIRCLSAGFYQIS